MSMLKKHVTPARCLVAFNRCQRLVWSGLVWSGLVWSGLVWSGLVWSGLVWSGLVWSGLVWSGLVWSGLVWSGLVWSGLVWSGLVWSGLVWSGLVWSGLVWSGLVCTNDAHTWLLLASISLVAFTSFSQTGFANVLAALITHDGKKPTVDGRWYIYATVCSISAFPRKRRTMAAIVLRAGVRRVSAL